MRRADDITFKELGKKWGISSRRVLKLAEEGRLSGAYYHAGIWWAPKDIKDPRKPHGKPRKAKA